MHKSDGAPNPGFATKKKPMRILKFIKKLSKSEKIKELLVLF